MCALMTFRYWLIFAILCAAAAAVIGWQNWPNLPLDSGVDPATLAAYQAAVIAHWIKYAAIGFGIPVLLLLVGRVACGKRPERL